MVGYGSKLDKSQNLQHKRDLWCENYYGDSRTQKKEDNQIKKMKILKYRTEQIEFVETERFRQNSYLASLLEIGFAAEEKMSAQTLLRTSVLDWPDISYSFLSDPSPIIIVLPLPLHQYVSQCCFC